MEPNLSKSGHFVVDIIADMTTDLKTYLISYSLMLLLMTNKARPLDVTAKCWFITHESYINCNKTVYRKEVFLTGRE